MFRRSGSICAIVVVGLLIGLPAKASTISDAFTFADSSNTVIASGSFSYNSSHSGQLTFADLSAFSINMVYAGEVYDLSFVNSVSNYKYFGFDTSSNTFVPAPVAGSVGAYYGILSATNSNLTQGFFLDPLASQGGPNSDGVMEAYLGQRLATALTMSINGGPELSFAAAATPLPTALPLFATGLGALGLFGWPRKRRVQAPVAA